MKYLFLFSDMETSRFLFLNEGPEFDVHTGVLDIVESTEPEIPFQDLLNRHSTLRVPADVYISGVRIGEGGISHSVPLKKDAEVSSLGSNSLYQGKRVGIQVGEGLVLYVTEEEYNKCFSREAS